MNTRTGVLLGALMAITIGLVAWFVAPTCAVATSPATPLTSERPAEVESATSGARIEIQSQTGTSLSLKFFDQTGAQYTVNFERSSPQELWTGVGAQAAVSGIIFGNTQPRFAAPARQRALGISPQQAITTFDTSITARPMDDVTIYQLGGGDMAIALWQSGVVTEIWYVGALVSDVMDVAYVGWNFCARAASLCCRTLPGYGHSGNPRVPKPNIAACKAAAQNCGEQVKEQVCNCLNYACEFCFIHAEYCCGDEEIEEGDPPCDWPWLPDASEAACVAGVEVCVDPPDPPDPDVDLIDQILEEITNRLQVLVDLQNG